ncbi:MAG: SCO family protein [Nitrospira sp.]|nr:SCO family protein [Nitrospira sp.]MDH4304306.1 SCO family protein [Nitrospira sp.]MDH5195240.1 SCO family protein [Nitrospira sp.]
MLRLVLSVWILSGGMVALAEMTTPTIPDIEVIDQDGGTHRLYSDLIKGKTVAITFLYTSCKTSCPAMTGLFGAVQQRLQDGSQRLVTLLSISLDPVTDRPAQLKVVAQRFGAAPGWYFLTGTYSDVARVLSALNAAGPQLSDHPSMILVGNDATGQWTRHYGLASVPMVMDLIDSVNGSTPHR